MEQDPLYLLQLPEQQFFWSESDPSCPADFTYQHQDQLLHTQGAFLSESYLTRHVPGDTMQTDISHMIPLDQIAGFNAVWCTDNIITGGSHIHCALPQTSATTVRPLEFPPQIRLVTPERTPGKVDRPFEVAPTTINPPGCVNPLRPPAIDQPDLFAGDPGAMHKNRQHCVKKQSHPAAPCRDPAAGLPASRILFENAPDPIPIVPTTAPSKPRHRLIAFQDQRPSKTSTATRASKAGGAAAGCRKQHRMGKQKNKGKHKMTRASARVTPYQQHVMELLTIIKRECPRG